MATSGTPSPAIVAAKLASRFAQSARCASSSDPPLIVELLSFHSAGGDQGAAQTFAPRATAFLAVWSSVVMPSGLICTRSNERPMPVVGEKNRSAIESDRFGAVHALDAPKPSMC